MAYEVKQRGTKFVVVDTETKRIRGTYDDEDSAEDRKDDLDFKNEVRGKLSRMPVSEMTPEEKAAAYDKMMAEKNDPPDPKIPPKKEDDPTEPTEPKVRRSAYWGELPGES
jgi:hypothetical protein